MSVPSFDAIVVSPSTLIRELLAALLRARGVARVATCASPSQSLALLASAPWFVCESGGVSAAEFASYREALARAHPQARAIRVDESTCAAALDPIVAGTRSPRRDKPPHESLTPLELEVMLAIATGLRNAEVARRMRRSTKTVEKHRANALRKLGFRNVAQLTAYALRHELLDGESILGPRAG